MNDCQHEWTDVTRDVRNQRVFVCGKCKLQRLVGALSELVIQAERQLGVPELTWTTEKPTKEGLYWYREIVNSVSIPTIVQVVPCPHHGIDKSLEARKLADSTIYHLRELRGEWAGPLEPPQ